MPRRGRHLTRTECRALPSFEDEDEEHVYAFLDMVRDLVAEQDNWNVRDAVVLSVFSFHKEVMYRDLQNNEVVVDVSRVLWKKKNGVTSC